MKLEIPPRDSPHHKRIVRIEPIANTRGHHQLVLECGHSVWAVGNLAHVKGIVFCTGCRDLEEEKHEERSNRSSDTRYHPNE